MVPAALLLQIHRNMVNCTCLSGRAASSLSDDLSSPTKFSEQHLQKTRVTEDLSQHGTVHGQPAVSRGGVWATWSKTNRAENTGVTGY